MVHVKVKRVRMRDEVNGADAEKEKQRRDDKRETCGRAAEKTSDTQSGAQSGQDRDAKSEDAERAQTMTKTNDIVHNTAKR